MGVGGTVVGGTKVGGMLVGGMAVAGSAGCSGTLVEVFSGRKSFWGCGLGTKTGIEGSGVAVGVGVGVGRIIGRKITWPGNKTASFARQLAVRRDSTLKSKSTLSRNKESVGWTTYLVHPAGNMQVWLD
jgi:hypothetical protein